MIHHQSDIGLGIQAKVFTFRNAVANEFVVPLAAPLLKRCAGVAVKQPGPLFTGYSEFNGFGIAEFTAIVSEKKRENFSEVIRTKAFRERIKDINNRLGIICIPKEGQHHFILHKMDSKKHFATLLSFNRIELYNRDIRMLLCILLESFEVSSDSTVLVDLKKFFPFSSRILG